MDVKEELEQWIVEELSVPDPDLNNIWPCPYAKKAWFENQVKVIETEDDFWDVVNEEVDNFNDDHQVVMHGTKQMVRAKGDEHLAVVVST